MSEERAKPLGRPTIYTDELADKICDLVATHTEGLDELCRRFDWMPGTNVIYGWRHKHPIFSQKYLQAKQSQAELYAEETFKIASQRPTYFDAEGNERVDAGAVAWQKMNVNLRQWHASKLAPKVYGDKQQTEVNASAASVEAIAQRVAEINKQAEKEY